MTTFDVTAPVVSRPLTNRPDVVIRRNRLVLVLPVAAALIVRVFQLLHPGSLLGYTEYDDGVYMGEILRLAHGALPYRDFVAVNPPGIMVLLSPVGWLSSFIGADGALAVARGLTVAVDVTNVALVGLILRRRGRAAQITGMTLLALYPGEVAASHTLLLEPYVNLLCLLAVLALFGRAGSVSRTGTAAAGALLGLACTVKLFAVFPVVAIGALLLLARQRLARRFFIAVAAGSGIVSLPFMLASPSAFFHQVFLDQVQRSGVRTPMWERLVSLSGAVLVPTIGHLPGPVTLAAALIAVSVLLLIIVGHRRTTLLSIENVGLAVFSSVLFSLLWANEYYYHYASALAPWLAILVAISLPSALRGRRIRPVLTAVAVLVFALSLTPAIQPVSVAPNLRSAMQAVIPPGSCVVADSPAYDIIGDRFNLPPGCPEVVDSFGVTMQLTGGNTNKLLGRGHASAVSAYWENAFSRADYVVLSGDDGGRIPISSALKSYLDDHFRVRATLPARSGVVYQKA